MAQRRTKPGNPKLAVAYIRVSTDEQRLGPDAQRHEIQVWAEREKVSVSAWHVDHGVSGASPVARRPALLDALSDIQALGAGLLVAAKRDRLVRDMAVSVMLQREVQQLGATIVTATESFLDLTTPEGLFMSRVLDATAELERARIAMRTRAALRTKKRNGQRLGGIPFGYQVASDGVHLQRNETEQRILTRVRELSGSGMSQRKIARMLASEGIVGRTGRHLSQVQVGRLLARREGTASI